MASSSSNCTRITATLDEEASDATDMSKLVLQEIGFVKESFEAVKIKASQKIDEANLVQKQFEELMVLPAERAEEKDYKLRQLKMKVSKLRMQIPFKLIVAPSEQPHPINIIRWRRLDSNLYGDNEIRENQPDIDDLPVPLQKILSVLSRFPYRARSYMACFVFFPQNAVIKRCVLFCLRPTSLVVHYEKELDFLVDKGLVQVVYKKSNLSVDGYRMHPSVHSYLRKEERGYDREDWVYRYVGRRYYDVEERFIFHTAQDFQWFTNYRIRYQKIVLHLGKWNNSTEQHIEIIDPELFFKDLSKMTDLRAVSLRGISMIEVLPKFITELKYLECLDLRACHNLEVILPSIADLKGSLTYLDISECYFLDHMPKALASLIKLRVLKGFVVGANKDGMSCSLEELESLTLLHKLNIYTSMKRFPTKRQRQTLKGFESLLSLTISWGGCVAPNGLINATQEDKYDRLKEPIVGRPTFHNLLKLDLQCVPETVTRRWLKPARFRNLEKLYIRGGRFFDLGQPSEKKAWNVETLRLKHLSNLNMDWDELQRSFPKLVCLEKVNCPNLHRFPCNDNGVWMKKQQV